MYTKIVKNDFSRFLLKLSQWITAGFAVVMLDNRGSFNRGKKFESYIQVIVNGSITLD